MSAPRLPAATRAAAALLLALAPMVAGCGAEATSSPPTGVDELVIPTPDPAAEDFVDVVDNPWFPLPVGARWRYEDGLGATGTETTVVRAVAGPERDGVRLTDRVTTVTGATRTGPGAAEPIVERTVDHYAQDRAGNVWWWGRDEVWFDAPGLAMPASPRRADGFRMALAPGLDVRAEVTSTDATVLTPLAEYEPAVVLQVTTGDAGFAVEYFAEGVGLVRDNTAGLVAYGEPR
ncbi:hypothetical protein E8D34_11265 [Nocardioides sp. GY 10113]|uniref:hypothetical protein n=1 Tax=Nocardioides sp. GY 10113 TaxID=2569761 RepID=UPI0010A82EC6|nr:hypothetical protein [Nocardioides sp. GY 10113]TIC86807.1 hypothetical protein E8D34_11265 [Nocardioides sp. GY 10113]